MQVLSNRHGEGKGNGAAQPPRAPGPAGAGVKFQRLVGHLHALGPRPIAEFLTELTGHDEEARSDVLLLLERYVRLDPAAVEAVGGDCFPQAVFAVADI